MSNLITDFETEWEKEIASRIQAYDAGEIEADDYADIQMRMHERFKP